MQRYNIQSFVWGAAGFVVGAGVVVLAEIVVIAAFSRPGYQIIPRGLGWVTIPIVAGIAGAGLGARFRIQTLDDFLSRNQTAKIALVGLLSWFIVYLGYVFLAQPYGSYWGDREWGNFWRWMLIPPVLFAAVCGLLIWAARRRSAPSASLASPNTDELEGMSNADKIRATIEPLIATSKSLGATSPRQAFDMTIGRASTDAEWERHRQPWELLWPHIKPLRQ